MRTSWVLPVLLLSVLVTPAPAKGCLKGAVVGGVAGHYAGHHGVMGAVTGCALGIHKRREYKREMRTQHQSGVPTTTQRSVAPGAPQSTY